MSFWSSLIGGGVKDAGDGIKTALDGAGGFLKDIRTAVTGKDPELDAKLLAAQEKIDAAQAEINKVEAGSSTFFVAGWRPAIGWVCAVSLALYYPLRVIIGMVMWVRMAWGMDTLPPMPEVGIADVLGLVMSLLGMSSLRTIEKKSDVAR
jgi:hypothetical protein